MRKFIKYFIVVVLCVFPMLHGLSSFAQTNAEIEEIELTQEEKPDSKSEGRNIIIISAYFNHQTSEIEIIAVGVGTSIVTIKNSSGRIIAQTIIYPTDEIGFLVVPEVPGTYQISINSDRHYSYGYIDKI